MLLSSWSEILDVTLVLFIEDVYPEGCHLVQNNDLKHCLRAVHEFHDDREVVWKKTPAESPDLNPIECLWHKLRVH